MINNVIVLKLKNGDTVFGELLDQTSDSVTLRSPVQFVTRFGITPQKVEFTYLFPVLYFPYGEDDSVEFSRADYHRIDIANSYYEGLYFDSLLLCLKNEEHKMEAYNSMRESILQVPNEDSENSGQFEDEVYNDDLMPEESKIINEELQNNDEEAVIGSYGYMKNEDGTLGSFMIPNKQTKH